MNLPEEEMSCMQELDELIAAFQQKSAEERALIILRAWFNLTDEECRRGEAVSEEMKRPFFEWFDSPYDRQAKEIALQRIINEMECSVDDTTAMPG